MAIPSISDLEESAKSIVHKAKREGTLSSVHNLPSSVIRSCLLSTAHLLSGLFAKRSKNDTVWRQELWMPRNIGIPWRQQSRCLSSDPPAFDDINYWVPRKHRTKSNHRLRHKRRQRYQFKRLKDLPQETRGGVPKPQKSTNQLWGAIHSTSNQISTIQAIISSSDEEGEEISAPKTLVPAQKAASKKAKKEKESPEDVCLWIILGWSSLTIWMDNRMMTQRRLMTLPKIVMETTKYSSHR